MDLEDFGQRFGSGQGLSVEERAALEIEMEKRKFQEKLHSIQFWGRINAINGHYFIVCGTLSTSEFPVRKWYYASSNDLVLKQLPELTEDFSTKAQELENQRFTGDPGKVLDKDYTDDDYDDEDEDEDAPPPVWFSEEHRLAWTVQKIDRDTGVVPRGAFVVTPTHHVIPNAGFTGLPAAEAANLSAYQHFRVPEHPSRTGALSVAGIVPSDDFLDNLAEDKPQGCWAVNLDSGTGTVRISSLKWPGYSSYHQIGTNKYGAIYIGDARVNTDLQFML